MDPNPPQGDTYYCWAASVVCAAHDLGLNVEPYRSVAGVDRLVNEYGKRVGTHAGMKHVLALSKHLGLAAKYGQHLDAESARALVAEGSRLVVNWKPSTIQQGWYMGDHMGAVLAWTDKGIMVTDSCADPAHLGTRAELRPVPVGLGATWFKPRVVILSL